MTPEAWTAVSAIAASVAAIAAAIAVFQALRGSRARARADRPVFTIGMLKVTMKADGKRPEFVLSLRNDGKRPAVDVRTVVAFISSKFVGQLPYEPKAHGIVNQIAPGETPTLQTVLPPLDRSIPLQYVPIGVSYRDPVLDERFEQYWYMKWLGGIQGELPEGLVHLTTADLDVISTHLKPFREEVAKG